MSRTRPQFWLALICATIGGGAFKITDGIGSVIDRLARLEAQVADMHNTVDAIERREERARQ
jgi:hypothetical protein